VVAERAPQELPVVEGLFRLDDARAVRVLAGSGARREPLGFGLAEAGALVTAVVWLVLDQVARRAVDAAADGVVGRARAGLRRVLRGGSAEPPRSLPELDRAQLTRVRAQILRRAAEQGLDDRTAQTLADTVVAHLAVGDAGTEARDDAADDAADAADTADGGSAAAPENGGTAATGATGASRATRTTEITETTRIPGTTGAES
jgi:hypothetical protein